MLAPTAPADSPSNWQLFRKLLPADLLNDLDPKAPQAVYTPHVVTWLLVYQRLQGNAPLHEAVAELTLRFPADALPDGPRARQQRLSANTGAYSLARSRLDIRVLYWAAEHVFDSLVRAAPGPGRRVFVLDGTTVQLEPTLPLRAAYPPATNQHGASHWPVLHLAVAHELDSGLATRPEWGPMYGPEAVSELALTRRLLARLPGRAILLGDRNFGVFAFAWAAAQAGHGALLRLTKTRFGALRQRARPAGAGRWALQWRPSRWDRRSHPELPADAAVGGWLHEVALPGGGALWLFGTEEEPGSQAAALYHRRQQVETDIGDLKQTLELDRVRGRSVDMVHKELLVGILAYNLANQVRRLAAREQGVEPRRLSFAGVWSLLKVFLTCLPPEQPAREAEALFARLLRAAGQRRLPRRRADRSYPREVIPRRRKFPERQRAKPPPQ